MTWATLSGDQYDEVLVFTKVQTPEPQQMFDDLVDCMSEATDDRVRKLGAPETWYDTAEKLVNEGPWQVHTDDQATLLLYKLWYDTITLRMGVKPQVHLHSKVKPHGMPNHWVHVLVPHEVIVIDDDREAPIPVAEVQPVQAQPAQQLPWYHLIGCQRYLTGTNQLASLLGLTLVESRNSATTAKASVNLILS